MTDVKICWMMRNNLTLLNIDHLISNRSQGDDNSHVDEDWREYGRLFVKNPRGVRLRSRRVIDTSGEYETFNSIWINDDKVESVVCWRLIRSSVDDWLECYVRNNISDVSAVVLLSKVAQIEYNSQIGRDIIDVHASSSLGN